MKLKSIELPMEQIQTFCDCWQIIEFALFGSVLRDDFRPNSDIDVLVTFAPEAKRGLSETLQMRDELQAMFERKIDLIVKAAIERVICIFKNRCCFNAQLFAVLEIPEERVGI